MKKSKTDVTKCLTWDSVELLPEDGSGIGTWESFKRIANTDLTSSDIPSPDADWFDVQRFALSYWDWTRFGSFDKCLAFANEGRPESLDELRTCLFFEHQRWRHFGVEPGEEFMVYIRWIVEKIREHVEQGRTG